MMNGSEVEHAVLLANYFNGMGKKAFLVMGKGVPEGATAYVLSVEENGDQWLWNAVSGEHFNVAETFCPLEAIYAIMSDGKGGSTTVFGFCQSFTVVNSLHIKYQQRHFFSMPVIKS